MEKDNTIITAAALAPSAVLLTATLILAIRFHYRLLWWVEVPNAASTVIINQQINPALNNNDIPLQPQTTIHAPVLRWVAPVPDFSSVNREMEDSLQSSNGNIQDRESPTPPRRHTPFIILSLTTSSTPYVVRSPSPSETDIASHQVRFQLGHHSRPVDEPRLPWQWQHQLKMRLDELT